MNQLATLVHIPWKEIAADFDKCYDEVFLQRNAKAHFDFCGEVIDGAKERWRQLLLLDAVLCIFCDCLPSDHRSVRRQFEHHDVFRACILSCYDKHVAPLLSTTNHATTSSRGFERDGEPSSRLGASASSSSSMASSSDGDHPTRSIQDMRHRQGGDEPQYHIMGYRSAVVPSSSSSIDNHQLSYPSSSLNDDKNESNTATTSANRTGGVLGLLQRVVEVHPSQIMVELCSPWYSIDDFRAFIWSGGKVKKGFAKRKKIVDSMCEAPFVQGRDGLVLVINTVVRSIVARRHIIEKERPEDSIPAGGDYFSGLGGVYKQMMEKRKVIHGPTVPSAGGGGGVDTRMDSYDEEESKDDDGSEGEEGEERDEDDDRDVEKKNAVTDRSDGEEVEVVSGRTEGGLRREQRKRTHAPEEKQQQQETSKESGEQKKKGGGSSSADDRGQREQLLLHKEGNKKQRLDAASSSAAGQLSSSTAGAAGASSATTGWRKAWRMTGGGASSTDDSNPLILGGADRGMPASFLLGTAAARGDRFLLTGNSSGSSIVSSMSTATSLSSLPPRLPTPQHASYFPSAGLLPQQNSVAAIAAAIAPGTSSAATICGHPAILTPAGLPLGPGTTAAVPPHLYSEGALLAREFGFHPSTALLLGSGSSGGQHSLVPPFYRAPEVEGMAPGSRPYYPLLSSSALNTPGINLGEYYDGRNAINVPSAPMTRLPAEVIQQQNVPAASPLFPSTSSSDDRLGTIPNLPGMPRAPPGGIEDPSSWAGESTTDDGSDRASVSAASSRSDFPPSTTDASSRSAAIVDKLLLPSFVHLGKYSVRPGKSPGQWCKPGCVVGLYVDGIGEAFPAAALALGVVVDQTEAVITTDTTADPSGDCGQEDSAAGDLATSVQFTVALQGEVTVVLPPHRSADMLRFWKGGKNDYLCVDASGNVGFWDQKSTGSRVFGIALWQQTEFTADGRARGLRVMLFPQLDAVLPIRLEFQRMAKQLQDSNHRERRHLNRQSMPQNTSPEEGDEAAAAGAFKSTTSIAANESTKSDISSSSSSVSREDFGGVKVATAIGPGSARGSSSLPSV